MSDKNIPKIGTTNEKTKKKLHFQQTEIETKNRRRLLEEATNVYDNQVAEEELKIKRQKQLDAEIETVCKKCKHLIDESGFYGASEYEIKIGVYYFCKATEVLLDDAPMHKSSLTGDYSIKSDPGKYLGLSKKFHIDEPAAKYGECVEINNGKCKMYEEKIENHDKS